MAMIEHSCEMSPNLTVDVHIEVRGERVTATVEMDERLSPVQLAHAVKRFDDVAVGVARERGIEKEFTDALMRIALIDALSDGLKRKEAGGHVG